MKKFVFLFLAIIYIFCCTLALTACDDENTSQVAENNILIVDGDGKQATNMKALLDEMDYTSTIVTPNTVPAHVADLAKYNEVILMNVNIADLPSGYDKELDAYVKTYGGGLFTTGGDQMYLYDGMNGTMFDSMLPINIIPENNSASGFMFVIDASSSMYYDFNNGGGSDGDCFYDENSEGFKNTPMCYIKQGLKQATFKTFNKNDYFGVIHFGRNSYKIDLPLTSASRLGAFVNAVNSITSIKGTSWSKPLQAAAQQLSETAYNMDKKQIILITDGNPAELTSAERNIDFANLTKSFEDQYGITTSVIAVNGYNTVNTTLMNNITTAVDKQGKKRFYNCVTPEAFIQAISNECKSASTKKTMIESGNYEVEITATAENSPVFNGIVSDGNVGVMPNITQYNGITVKASDGVQALLIANNTENNTHDAIYAQWTYGKGRVGSFASDLCSWAKDYYTAPEAKLFLKNAIKEILLKN